MDRVPAASGCPSDLLERASQLATLGKALMAVRESSFGQMVLVSGEAGIGKTALLQSFCETLDPSVRLLRGSCDPLFAPPPLGPLLAVAEGLQGRLKQIVRSGSAPHDVALALAREFRSLSPSLFILEDLHWADEATLDVLMILSRRVETVPVLIVATYRDEGLDRAHPLRRLLGEFATRRPVLRLKLAPLSAGAVGQLARQHGADPRDLYEKTGGNPFFVIEALASGVDEIPPTVRDAVLAEGYNVGSGNTCLYHRPGDISHGAQYLVGPDNNGGSTKTDLPTSANPGIGAIPYGADADLGQMQVPLCPTSDQRGTYSPDGQPCDTGAVQP